MGNGKGLSLGRDLEFMAIVGARAEKVRPAFYLERDGWTDVPTDMPKSTLQPEALITR